MNKDLGGFGTGELRSFGYQGPQSKGPVRATDIGFRRESVSTNQGFGNRNMGDQFEHISTKSTLHNGNNNQLRQGFNPNKDL